jgi:hypothetical protein
MLEKSNKICYNKLGGLHNMKAPEYYDGTELLSKLDINGEKPEIYLCTSNRTGGKTTYFNKMSINKFKKGHGKFLLTYRYSYELCDCADKFFKDIANLFFPHDEMTSKSRAKGIFHELFLNEESCGYAVAINAADNIKKYSHVFNDANWQIFDEFQTESGRYCPDEVRKFISLHTSIARGNGKQYRKVPVYMIGNPVSIINPYYVELGISERLRDDTRFLRGDGWVLEQGYVKSASDAQKEAAFNRAFARNDYVAYSAECIYLNDSKAFIEKPTGKGRYLGTLKYNGVNYGLREFSEDGFIYCDDRPDLSHPLKITVTTADHEVNYVMLTRHDLFIDSMRYFFERGAFRFKDLRCKEAVLKALSY